MDIQFYTSTYNRPELLARLYKNLKSIQRVNDLSFRWLVLYNGVNKKSMEIHELILSEGIIPYSFFILDKNIGLTRALNIIHEKLDSSYAIRLDDDDLLTSDSLIIIKELEEELEKNHKLGGAIFDIIDPRNEIIGKPLKSYPRISNNYQLHYRLNLTGDKARLYKSSILRELRYSEIENELYVPDAQVYYLIDYSYDIIVVPKSLIIREYYPDGLTVNLRKSQNEIIMGILEYYEVLLRHPDKIFTDHIRISFHIVYSVLVCNEGLKKSFGLLQGFRVAKFIFLPSYIVYRIVLRGFVRIG
jgi:hypothetical protein